MKFIHLLKCKASSNREPNWIPGSSLNGGHDAVVCESRDSASVTHTHAQGSMTTLLMSAHLTTAGEALLNRFSATQTDSTARYLDEPYAEDPFLDEILSGAVFGSSEITDPDLEEIFSAAVFNHGFTINEASVYTTTLIPVPDLVHNPIAAHTLGRATCTFSRQNDDRRQSEV
ncbi:hypothetical protein VTL71DRAFT_5011 [Oculimacula yallundae]|uniref:Uncharacterized protein n=1 Tax=Oculimacula yallundae TaxID=86028 RepID=A0ABR4C0K0_9HELO